MSGELVQLRRTDVVAQGNRYTDADKEAAYQYWRTAGGRSFRRTASKLKIADNTIRSWAQSQDWAVRANSEDNEDVYAVRAGTAALVTQELVKSIETVVEVRDDPAAKHKDRLMAAFWLAGLAGVSPVSRIEQAVNAQVIEVVEALPDFSSMTTQEIRAWEEQESRRRRAR